MTKEEYTDHLCGIIMMVFTAEHEVNRQGLSCQLKEGVITPDQYVRAIAEEIVNNIDEELYKNEQL